MNETPDTAAVLRIVFPDECDAVGPALVDRLVRGEPVAEPAQGRRMDLKALIELLANALTVITGVIALRNELKARLGRQPAAQELQAAVRASALERGALTAEQQDRIAAAVADKGGTSGSGPQTQPQGSQSDV